MNEISREGNKPGLMTALPFLILTALLTVIFFDGLLYMAKEWEREEYSHGYLIPVIAMMIVWQQRAALAKLEWRGTWFGVAVVAGSMMILLLGELSTLYTLIQYAFLFTLFGLVLAVLGWGGLRLLWVALVYLFFMIPLPNFFYHNLSQQLQLISSQIGVLVIRAFDISVYLEGNVIDLGTYQLQVVEACSGLNYLFPLMSFGFLCAYLFRAPWWQRTIVFLSSIPLTVLMNSFRIGVIGVLVEHFGIEQAEGFLHYFEGWIIFMSCVGIMLGEMWLFARFTKPRRAFSDVFNVDFGEPVEGGFHPAAGVLKPPFLASLAVIGVVGAGTMALDSREEIVPQRSQFAEFPLRLQDWRGREEALRQKIVDVLKVDDYLLADYYRAGDVAPVNLYVAYYDSQRKGASIHSPRSCLPGNDWEISGLGTYEIDTVEGVDPFEVNRVVITKGDVRQLVYYWFEQRGRTLTSEYAVKWYLLWDAIDLNRTDGALVRLTTPVPPGTSVREAEERMQGFLQTVHPHLDAYLPSKDVPQRLSHAKALAPDG